jgi:uncharacterized membrane protein (DUF106 family)
MPISNGKREWDDMGLLRRGIFLSRVALTIAFSTALTIFASVIIIGANESIGTLFGDDLTSPQFVLLMLVIATVIGVFITRGIRDEITESQVRTKGRKR